MAWGSKQPEKRGGQPEKRGSADAGKKGGSRYRAPNEYQQEDKGLLTCDRCLGSGTIQREHLAADSDGDAFTDLDEMKCPVCGGSGTVKKK